VADTVLLDTGVVVALVNARDPDHARCVALSRELRARLVTVEGVLVEAAHLLRRAPGGPEAAIQLVLAAATEIVPCTAARLERAMALVRKYQDIPMDLVDALLVATAEERNVREVLTLDRRGFGAYRLSGRRTFSILP
jgi:predicted nucleic acid-binding protein